jgi:hypothetical protein
MHKYSAPKTWRGMYDLYMGKEIDELPIAHSLVFIKERWDCSDFRMVPLIRTLYTLNDRLSEDASRLLEDTIICFKYWYDEPGEDDMCYTTENHQILFHSCEYLAGQYFKDRVFRNSELTGAQHQEKARHMILQWLEDRFVHGMSEWHSPVYYEEDIGPLCNLIDFAEDEEIAQKSRMIVDLLLLDIGMHSYKGGFAVDSGRCYLNQAKFPKCADTAQLAEHIWKFGLLGDHEVDYGRLSTMFYMMEKYEVPEVIRKIGHDDSTVELKTSNWMDLDEFAKEIRPKRNWEDAGRTMWSMGAYTHPKAINLTMKMIHRYRMSDNFFMRRLKRLDHPLLRILGIHKVMMWLLQPSSNGMMLERNNSYVYKTKDYMLATAQNYHPGRCGDQEHVWGATLSTDVAVFTNHPGTADPEGKYYWAGSARLPHSVQYKNVHLSIYSLPAKKAHMEQEYVLWTHLYFPTELFERTVIRDRSLFGEVDGAYVAVRGTSDIVANPDDSAEFFQRGQQTCWVCELGSKADDGSFEDFVARVEASTLTYANKTLTYRNGTDFELRYKGAFTVDGAKQSFDYPRFDTPYVQMPRNSRVVDVEFGGHKLHLDFDRLERRFD